MKKNRPQSTGVIRKVTSHWKIFQVVWERNSDMDGPVYIDLTGSLKPLFGWESFKEYQGHDKEMGSGETSLNNSCLENTVGHHKT